MFSIPARLLPWPEVERRVPYTRQHLSRLEKQNKFPRRVRLGGKVAWVESEVDAWIETRAAEGDRVAWSMFGEGIAGGVGGPQPAGGGGAHPSASVAAREGPTLDGEVIPPAKATVGWCGPTGEQSEELASRINATNAELLEGVRATVAKAVALGKLLIKAKRSLRHGAWLAWLERNTQIKPRMATNYMELAAEFPLLDRQKRQRISDLGIAGALRDLHAVRNDVRRWEAKARPFSNSRSRVSGPTPQRSKGYVQSPTAGPAAASVAERSLPPAGFARSGQELFEEIVSIRKESDRGDPIARLNELKTLDRHSGRRLELLDAHIEAQALFLAKLRSLREQVHLDAAVKGVGA